MEKIILTEKTVGNIVNRLKKFMEAHVFKSQMIYNKKPNQARRPIRYDKKLAGKEYSRGSYYMNAKVTRHPFSKGERLPFLRDDRMPLVHVEFHKDAGTCFHEGDVFYFYGSMILIDLKRDIRLKGQSSIGDFEIVVDKYELVHSPDANLIANIKREYEMEEAFAKDYWDSEYEWAREETEEDIENIQKQ